MARNLTRKQKIYGIIAAATVAIGATVSAILIRRKDEKPQLGPEGTSTPTPPISNLPVRAALQAMCLRPQNLSAMEQDLLVTDVFLPMWGKVDGADQIGPDELSSRSTQMASLFVNALGCPNKMLSVDTATRLLRDAWMRLTGASI